MVNFLKHDMAAGVLLGAYQEVSLEEKIQK
jgi:hypothetical protein